VRTFKGFLSDIIKKPPLLFPLVGLFHVLWLLWTIWDDRHEPFPDMAWLQLLWLAAYTFFWLAVCDLRKWGLYGYIFLAVVNTLLFLAARKGAIRVDYTSNMLWVDLLFGIFLLYYYKMFDPPPPADEEL
jgi:hypothetical protein